MAGQRYAVGSVKEMRPMNHSGRQGRDGAGMRCPALYWHTHVGRGRHIVFNDRFLLRIDDCAALVGADNKVSELTAKQTNGAGQYIAWREVQRWR